MAIGWFGLQVAGVAAEAVVNDADSIDHAGLIQGWGPASFGRGEALYNSICITCHGNLTQAGSLPTSRPFWKEPFKNGSDPLSLYRTMSEGLGQMPAWTFLSPEQRYDAIHFIREAFVKPHNPKAYFEVTPAYLAGLPKGSGHGKKSAEMLAFEQGPAYLRMDFGPALFWTLEVETNNIAYKGIAVRLDSGPGGISKGHAWMLYDHDTLRVAAAWTGDRFVDWRGIAFDGSHQTHTRIVGRKILVNPVGPGWADPGSGRIDDPRLRGRDARPYGPLPREWAHYQGLYLHGGQVLLAYTVGMTRVLEAPGLESAGEVPVFSRTLNVGPCERELRLRIAPAALAVKVVGLEGSRLVRGDGGWEVRVPASTAGVRFKVLFAAAGAEGVAGLESVSRGAGLPADLEPFTRGGPGRWNPPLATRIRPGTEEGPFAVDELVAPPDSANPWHSWMRFGGFDFFKDGRRAAICTWNGDVWVVDGVGQVGEGQLTWKRIVSGLFQPLGLKVVDEVIHVACRDQIVRLRDLNGDGEVDYIENFNNDHQVTEHFHEFAMGLQTDAEGNFYYAKSARHALPALVPHHGTVLRVSRDGLQTEILANGFRAANGVCVNDDGTIFVTDQEGHWTPKNRINLVRSPARFFGNMWGYAHPESPADDQMEQPLVWITNDMDRSPGELVWVPRGTWGALGGSLLNLSYGTGRIFVVPHEEVGGQLQGGVAQLPMPDSPTGVMRGRFHPGDGHLYTCGLYGWAGNRQREGGFFRVRATGKPSYLPISLHAQPDGMEIQFSEAPDAASLSDPANYAVKVWGLKRSAEYGSKHLNERSLPVTRATVGPDPRLVRLTIAGLEPTWGMEIRAKLKASDGTMITRIVHNTIHHLPPAVPR